MNKFFSVVASLWLAACATEIEIEELGETTQDLYVDDWMMTWPEGDIPVCFETPGFPTEKGWVRDAIRTTWEAEANLELVGWDDCTAVRRGIRIQVADVQPTALPGTFIEGVLNGMKLNFTFVNFPQPCIGASRESCIRATAVHEFGHALGFAHEQDRPDKPPSCTAPSQVKNFGQTLGTFDPDSVMNECNPNRFNGKLSMGDVAGVQQLYGTRSPIAATAWIGSSNVDGFVHRLDQTLGGSAFWYSLGGVITGAPAVVSRFPGQFDAFVRGTGGGLFQKIHNNGSWIDFIPLGGLLMTSPAAASFPGTNRTTVFARGLDNAIHQRTFNGVTFGPWTFVGGNIIGAPRAVAVSSTRNDVFARGADGMVWTSRCTNGVCTPVQSLGGPIIGDPMPVVTGNDKIAVIVRGTDDALWIKRGTLSTNVWEAGFNQLGSNPTRGNPSAASKFADQVDILVRGTDSRLYMKTVIVSSLISTPYIDMGAQILSSPTVVSSASNRLEIFVRGTDSRLYKKSWNGSSWSGYGNMNQTFK